MKQWSLLYVPLAAALLAGLAHLRADWLAGPAERQAAAHPIPSPAWAAGREEPRMLWTLLRQR